jgi:exodeoxyribonuclease V beta subunit
MQPLEPLTLNLQGQILIEASAGTGKTYTIALLYLRLLLERELTVDEILVVTFTKAATEELRSRIRQRIRDALDLLEGRETEEQLLLDLVDAVADREWAAILLADALTRMDEAAIFTIHGFCQRMLQEHAFESGAPFNLEFIETEQLLHRQILEDFWRQRFYPADREEARWALSLWESPAALLNGLGSHLSRPDVACIPEFSEEELAGMETELLQLFAGVKSDWQDCRQEAVAQLRDSKRISRNRKTGYHQTLRLEPAIIEMDKLLSGQTPPFIIPPLIELFSSSKIAASLKKPTKYPPPDHSFFDRFDRFHTLYVRLNQARRFLVLLTARAYLQTELIRRKQEQSQLFFDDLLTQLDSGLQSGESSPLARSISKRFPVIMVDEFQDTDPLQYRIFATIHASRPQPAPHSDSGVTGVPGSGLFLIGDPKQAIYSFRGADIFTYIQARKDTLAGNRLTMDTNYRSTSGMVAAVNSMFDRTGSFLFDSNEMAFSPVRAAQLADNRPLRIDNRLPAPLTCLLLTDSNTEKAMTKGDAGELAARFSACEIAELLAAGQTGSAMIGDQPLQAADIAVLVRTHREAASIRKELSRLRIGTVYFSQDSIFASEEARQLRILLNSLIDLGNGSLIRTVLAGSLFAFNAEQLDQLRSDELAWERIMETMLLYRQLWENKGFTPMFQQLLADQQVVSRLHAADNGERMLTNYLHLQELLQEAGQQHPGSEGLLRWLSDQIEAPEERADSQQLRLESDEDLVKIVTIHAAKGLEYPVVFLPFLWSARICTDKDPLSFHRPEQPGQLFLDLGSGDEENLFLAERERLASDLRLLYVAITRARYCCYFCWGMINKMENSALCHLLHGGLKPDPATLEDDLASLNSPMAGLLIKPLPALFLPPTVKQDKGHGKLRVAAFQGQIDSSWQITSYSRLTAHNDPRPEQPDYDRQEEESEQEAGNSRFAFPKGAAAGTCLHAILEHISFSDTGNHDGVIADQLLRAGFADQWQPVVADWMQAIVRTGLPEPARNNGTDADTEVDRKKGLFSLADLTETELVNEMSFYFPLNGLDLNRFNRVLEDFSFAPLPDREQTLQGLMVGFIDLVFCFQGRYYIADYKSNHLGNTAADYSPARLEQAILEHRYDLQYLIYTLALHRFLQTRLNNYSYEDHFGGALYLFLRGMDPKHEPGCGVFAEIPPLPLIEQLDSCCAGQEEC